MPNALTNPGNTSANMLFVSPILANIWYWGIMNIWDGSIICTITRENKRFFPLNLSFANANPAAEENATAQSTRNRISSAVFTYNFIKGREAMARR